MEAIQFKMDISAMRQWLAAWKEFPREAGKWAAKFINDEAFEFKARPRSNMSDIVAAVGAWYGTGRGSD
jgi:hypothetical protein